MGQAKAIWSFRLECLLCTYLRIWLIFTTCDLTYFDTIHWNLISSISAQQTLHFIIMVELKLPTQLIRLTKAALTTAKCCVKKKWMTPLKRGRVLDKETYYTTQHVFFCELKSTIFNWFWAADHDCVLGFFPAREDFEIFGLLSVKTAFTAKYKSSDLGS
jgi:hypothetical protein